MGASQSIHEKVKEIEKMTSESYVSKISKNSKPKNASTLCKILSTFYTHDDT